jgi:ferredoxin
MPYDTRLDACAKLDLVSASMMKRAEERPPTASRASRAESRGAGKRASRAKQVLTIVAAKCIDCGFCRESCPYGVVFTTFTRKHQYVIMADGCMWCGGPGKAPCEVYCPVPGAIVPATYDSERGLMLNGSS